MDLQAFREELTTFYRHKAAEREASFREKIYALLDAQCTEEMNGYQRKVLQYKTIAEHCEPVLVRHSPFYYELGTMHARSDGSGDFQGHVHAGNWNYSRSMHKFIDQDPELWKVRSAQGENQLYLICGPYCDARQHFIFTASLCSKRV